MNSEVRKLYSEVYEVTTKDYKTNSDSSFSFSYLIAFVFAAVAVAVAVIYIKKMIFNKNGSMKKKKAENVSEFDISENDANEIIDLIECIDIMNNNVIKK